MVNGPSTRCPDLNNYPLGRIATFLPILFSALLKRTIISISFRNSLINYQGSGVAVRHQVTLKSSGLYLVKRQILRIQDVAVSCG